MVNEKSLFLLKNKKVLSVTLINQIWSATNWNKTHRYKIIAKSNKPSNLMIFDLKDAVASEIALGL